MVCIFAFLSVYSDSETGGNKKQDCPLVAIISQCYIKRLSIFTQAIMFSTLVVNHNLSHYIFACLNDLGRFLVTVLCYQCFTSVTSHPKLLYHCYNYFSGCNAIFTGEWQEAKVVNYALPLGLQSCAGIWATITIKKKHNNSPLLNTSAFLKTAIT